MPGLTPTGRHRILQIHLTRRCNLECLHCYSSSGPRATEHLPVDCVREVIADAAAEGYGVVGLSGGEPTLYDDLPRVLEAGHRCGMLTTVTSNGMRLRPELLAAIAPWTSVLAISLDGTPESHDRMRASTHAFRSMADNLVHVRASTIPFGFIFTLTQHNVNELDWVAGFAAAQGAALLQIHPLEIEGRASLMLADARPDTVELSFALAEALRIQDEVGPALWVQLDVAGRTTAIGAISSAASCSAPLSEIVSPLVVEPDGTVVPLRYGFPRPYALGNITERPLRDLAAGWRQDGFERFTRLADRMREQIAAGPELFNWYEAVASLASPLRSLGETPVAPSGR